MAVRIVCSQKSAEAPIMCDQEAPVCADHMGKWGHHRRFLWLPIDQCCHPKGCGSAHRRLQQLPIPNQIRLLWQALSGTLSSLLCPAPCLMLFPMLHIIVVGSVPWA